MRNSLVTLLWLLALSACATTTNIYTVKPNGGGDYLSLSAWESGRRASYGGNANLSSQDTVEIAECYGGIDTNNVTFGIWNVSPTNIMIIRSAERHAGVWDTNKYVLYTRQIAQIAFNCSVDYAVIDGIQFGVHTQTNVHEILYMSGRGQTVRDCIIRGARSTSWTRGLSVIYGVRVFNTLFYDLGTHGSTQSVQNHGDSYFYSCTFVNDSVNGVHFDDGTNTVANCYSYSAGAAWQIAIDAVVNFTTCAASDSTGVGMTNIALSTANFVNVTAPAQDFRLTATSALRNVGTDTSGAPAPLNFTTSIEGWQRVTPWDIGASEYRFPDARTRMESLRVGTLVIAP